VFYKTPVLIDKIYKTFPARCSCYATLPDYWVVHKKAT